eukprot:646828-Pelagomonas_calceolata.AAC.1
MLRESNFLAGPGLGIVIGKLTFWNDPKLAAKIRVGIEEFGEGLIIIRLPLAGRSTKVAVASVLRMAE